VSARRALAAAVAVAALAGCDLRDMWKQPKYKPLQSSDFFSDGRASRPLEPDTVARGQLNSDTLLFTGMEGGQPSREFPFPVTRQVLDRGQLEFNVFCSVCHGRTGDGNGMIVQRGFKPPPTFHSDRLRQAPPGHFFDVISNGFGAMYSYRSRIGPDDRWAIIAYIRALQLSHDARLADVPDAQRGALGTGEQ